MKTVRILLVGGGHMANTAHYPSLREMEGVEIAALCEIDRTKLARTADAFGIERQYTDFYEMLRNEEADAIYILMPPVYHFDLVMAAMSKGLHVFLEKPPAVTSWQMERFMLEARRNNVIGMVGFNRRYMPMVQYALDYLHRHSVAGISQIVGTFYKHRKDALFFNGAMDPLASDGVHALDLLRYLAGPNTEIAELHCMIGKYESETDNAWNALMRFDSGTTGILQTNYNTGGRVHTFELHSPGISMYLNPDDNLKVIHNGETTVLHTKQIAGSEEFRKYYGFYNENVHFIECVRELKEPNSNFEDALKTMRLIDRVKGSVTAGEESVR